MKKVKPFGNTRKEQLLAARDDRLFSFLLADKTVRGAVVKGIRMVNEMRSNHALGILETLVLGHAYLASALLSSSLKGNDSISLKIDCSGPVKGLVAEANAYGEVRGYLKQVPIPLDNPLESFDMSPFLGAGFLTVTRFLEDAKQPFSGNISLDYGSIAENIANYYLLSEQISTAVNLSIKFDKNGEVVGAGGLLLQAMPGADESVMARLEEKVKGLPSLAAAFTTVEPRQFIIDHFNSFSPLFLDDYRIEFMCRCTDSQIRQMLKNLPADERQDIIKNGPFPLGVRCHNCNTPYQFSKEQLIELYGKELEGRGK
jgi:molecular chaperone Hsp33